MYSCKQNEACGHSHQTISHRKAGTLEERGHCSRKDKLAANDDAPSRNSTQIMGTDSLIVCRKDQRPVPPSGQKNDDLFCNDERKRMYQSVLRLAYFLILFFPFL